MLLKELMIGVLLVTLLVVLPIVLVGLWLMPVMEAEHLEYIQLCQDNGFTELQCELRYKELEMSRSYDQVYISPGTGIYK